MLDVSVTRLCLRGQMAYDIGLPLDRHSELEFAIFPGVDFNVGVDTSRCTPVDLIQFNAGKIWLRLVRNLFKRVQCQCYCIPV